MVVAKEGVDYFRRENFQLIIVDTSGRHAQETALFAEMQHMRDALQPDNVVLCMDGSIGGEPAKRQAEAFHKTAEVGSVIVTKLDGPAKGVCILPLRGYRVLWTDTLFLSDRAALWLLWQRRARRSSSSVLASRWVTWRAFRRGCLCSGCWVGATSPA